MPLNKTQTERLQQIWQIKSSCPGDFSSEKDVCIKPIWVTGKC